MIIKKLLITLAASAIAAWGLTASTVITSGGGGGSGDALTTGTLGQFAATTSSQFKGVISDENAPDGASSKVVMALGSLSVASGKTGTFSNTLTLTGTDSSSVAFGAGGTVLYAGGAGGTPSSLTLTNATGLPLAGITGSTSTALGVGSIELGAASDTTIARSGAGAVTVEGTAVLLSGGAGGTPSSLTLTNATGLPVAGITASTATALGVGSIELGHASDTTIARSGAGAVTVEGTAVLLSGGALGTPSSATLSNATAATDGTAGVMSAADHTTLTSLSGQASGAAPVYIGPAVMVTAFKTGVDLKTNAVTDIFTVPAGKTFVTEMTTIVTTAVTSGASVSFSAKFIESGASANITPTISPGAAGPAVGKVYNSSLSTAASEITVTTGNKVQLSVTTGFTTSTAVTGTVYVQGYYF